MCAYGRGGRVGDAMFLNPEANGKGGRLPPPSQIWNDAPGAPLPPEYNPGVTPDSSQVFRKSYSLIIGP